MNLWMKFFMKAKLETEKRGCPTPLLKTDAK